LGRLLWISQGWLAAAALLAGLGQLALRKEFGAHPKWAMCGESFPVGCAFDSAIRFSEGFVANPDRRRAKFNCLCGVYRRGCGLDGVYMSWGEGEWLYQLLLQNSNDLPVQVPLASR
jgi:inositol oxygenase